jgi:predicted peptidase
MKQKLFYALVLVVTTMFSSVYAQQTAKMTSSGIGFLEYLPQGYNTNSNKYPIVIALHGIKEKGNTLSSVNIVANVGLPKYVKYGAQYPFILISPQLKTTMGRWTGDYVMQVLNYVKTYLRVDPNRIYLTGLSLGGGGVWSVATAYPNVWASILPICSGYNVLSGASAIANADLPVWGFHGDADAVVSESVTINMINAVNGYKPNPLAKLTIFPGMGHVIWDKVYKETSALTWLLSFTKGSTSTTTTGNAAPVANAGSDKSLTLPSNSATIYGSATDPDGSVTTYSWAKKSGGSVTMSGASSKTLAASNMVAGTYVFSLTVKDDKGASDTDDVTVVVKSSTTSTSTTTNVAPIANAGSDRIVVLPTTSTAITGSGVDSDGSISSYSWSKISGGSVSITGNTTNTLKLSSLVAGTYVFRLSVKDNKGAVDTDDVTVIVNKAPVAQAGSDRTVSLPLSSLALAGSGTDADGTIASYLWSKYSGPTLKMTNTTSATVTLSSLVQGTYVIKLQVKDNRGTSGYDYVRIVVNGTTASVEYLTESQVRLASLESSELNSLPNANTAVLN